MADLEEDNQNQAEWYSNPQQEQDVFINLDEEGGEVTEVQLGEVPSGIIEDPMLTKSRHQVETTNSSQTQFFDDFKSNLSQEMAGQLWQAGKQSTQRFIKTYAHIDILRPYFDVEPSEFRNRLLFSFIPNIKIGEPQEAPSELYGPTMLVFTLVAVLLYGMKTSGHVVEDGTLMGTALVVCLSYWMGVSMLVFFISYLVTAHLSLLQVLSLVGYSLTTHCLVLMLSTFFDHIGIPSMFYLFWIIFGLLSTMKMAGVLLSRSWTVRDGLILTGIVGIFHILSLLYLRLAYHKVYEAIANVI